MLRDLGKGSNKQEYWLKHHISFTTSRILESSKEGETSYTERIPHVYLDEKHRELFLQTIFTKFPHIDYKITKYDGVTFYKFDWSS